MTGGTPSRADPSYWGGRTPWISAKSLKQFDVWDSDERLTDAGSHGATLVPAGSVLFVVRGMSLAREFRVGVARTPVAFNQDLRALVPGDGVDGRYIARFLEASSATVLSLVDEASHGTKRLTSDRFESIRVPLPPLPEQRRIAAILDKADALRAKRRAALAKLDTLAESIFLDMFGDPLTNPRGLPVALMGDVCDVRDGTHDSPKYISDGGFPLVTSKNVTGGMVDLTDVNYISERDYVQINKRSRVDRGDIILPMIGTIGSPVLVDHEPHYAIKNVALIKFTTGSPSAELVHHLLSGHYFDQVVGRKNRGGTQKFVSLGDLRAFPLPLPPSREQAEFGQRVEAVGQMRRTAQRSQHALNDMFGVLQHRAFRGEL